MERDIRKKIRKALLENYIQENDNVFHVNMVVKDSEKNDIFKIKHTLNKNGFKMWIIGGAVRDTVRNVIKLSKNPMDETLSTPKDFDLVTDATPDEIKEIFSGADFISNILNIGESFAIQFLVTKSHNQYELATLRSDSGGGRKPDSVQYEKTIEKDSKRRDLTINALYYEITGINDKGFVGIVHDLVGGVSDIKNNIINTVGNPEDRFAEDPLRKIRAVRFAAVMDSEIPDNVAAAIRAEETSLVDPTGKKVSDERIRDEYYKGIKNAKSVVHFLSLLQDFDFFKHIFGTNLSIDLSAFANERHPIIVTANLLRRNNVKNIGIELNLKKYSSDEINCFIFLISLLKLDEDNASEIKKFYSQKVKNAIPKISEKPYPMTEEVVDKFANLNHIDKIRINNLLRLANEFVQPSDLLKSLGYKDRELGIAIARLEKEFFKNPNKVKSILDSGDAEEIKKIIFINKM